MLLKRSPISACKELDPETHIFLLSNKKGGMIVLIGEEVADSRIRHIVKAEGVTRLFYMGDDYSRLASLAAIGAFKIEGIGCRCHEAAKTLRRPFIDRVALLFDGNSKLDRAANRILEKNTLVNKFFLMVCRLRVARDLIGKMKKEECVAFLGDDRALLAAIADEALAQGAAVRTHRSWAPLAYGEIKGASGRWVGVFKYLLRSCIMHVLAMRLSQQVPAAPLEGKVYAIHTWGDQNCFDKDGKLVDRYFPGLAVWLVKQGYRVLYFPEMVNVSVRDFFKTMKKLLASGSQGISVLPREACLTWSDHVQPLRVMWRSRKAVVGKVLVDGMDVTRLLRAQIGSLAIEEAVLNYYFVRNLSARNVRIDHFLDAFEYMLPERLFQLGFKEHYPLTRTIGHQHFALSPNLLCSFVSACELARLALPDRIVSNGNYYKKILEQEGFPGERLLTGPALRYKHLMADTPDLSQRPAGKDFTVLIPLSLDMSSNREMVLKTYAALKDMPGLKCIFKPHPMMREKDLNDLFSSVILKDWMTVVKGDMKALLESADIGIVLASSAVLDIVFSGKPCIKVGCETNINIDPLGWDDQSGACYAPEEIKQCLQGMMRDYLSYKHKAVLYANEHRREYFGPVQDETMKAFLI